MAKLLQQSALNDWQATTAHWSIFVCIPAYLHYDRWMVSLLYSNVLKEALHSWWQYIPANWMLWIIFRTNCTQLSLLLRSVLCFVTVRCPCVNTKLYSMYRVHRVRGAGWETERFFLGHPLSSLSLSHAFIFTFFFFCLSPTFYFRVLSLTILFIYT